MSKRIAFPSVMLLVVLVLAGSPAAGGVPHTLQFQGKLTDSAGAPLTGTFTVTFGLYPVPTGGGAIWSESQTVSAAQGLFAAMLGTLTPLTDIVFDDSLIYLGIQVESDPELSPRTKLSSVAYALKVGTLDGATGGTVSGDLTLTGDLHTQKDEYLSIPVSAFNIIQGAASLTNNILWLYQGTGFTSNTIEASLELPDSAVVEEVTVAVDDSSATNDMTINFYKPSYMVGFSIIGSATTTGAAGAQFITIPGTPFTVSNKHQAYTLVFQWLSPVTDPGFHQGGHG